ncbi:hypothetical protein AB0D12_03420 [Streptomyces sp. NPDC048479]|uniref:hypothetical protein n=1 Tax=Streptomyces sp. NPDC048479 TaxID=3154725 RepID=UPI0034414F19
MLFVLSGVAVLGGGTGVYAATGDSPVPDRVRVRKDTEPLLRRFRPVGQLSDPRWLGFNPNDSGREPIPDQDPQIRVVGIAQLPAGAATSIVGSPAYGFALGSPPKVPEMLEQFLPEHPEWMSSPRYDRYITKSVYQGQFHFDQSSDCVYFDTLNPEVV